MPSPSMNLCVFVRACTNSIDGGVGDGGGNATIVIRHHTVVINETETNETMRIIIIAFISLFLFLCVCTSSKRRYINIAVCLYGTVNLHCKQSEHTHINIANRMEERKRE